MEAYARDWLGESETLRLLNQTHLQSPTTKEMHRYGPYRSPAEPQLSHSFARLHPPNFHVGTPSTIIILLLGHAFNFNDRRWSWVSAYLL